MALKDRIAEARKQKGLTQKELGKRIGASESTIKTWEQGRNFPTYDKVIDLIHALDVDANFLYQDAFDGLPQSQEEADERAGLRFTIKELNNKSKILKILNNPRESRRILQSILEDEEFEWFVSIFKELDTYDKSSVMLLAEHMFYKPKDYFDITKHVEAGGGPIPTYLDFRYFGHTSAGMGQMLLRDETDETIRIKKSRLTSKADYVLKVEGDSMEPRYQDGDLLLVKKQPMVDDGEIGIFYVDGKSYVKEKRGSCLRSLNRKYEDIPINDDTLCFGKVLGKAEQ